MYINFRSNKIIKSCGTTLLSLFFMVSVPLSSTLAQERGKIDVTSYTAPNGFETQGSSNSSARAFLKKYSEGKFALVTLYASTGSFGDANTDFSRRWKQLFSDMAKSKSLPQTERSNSGGISIVTGGDSVTYEGVEAIGVLTTLTVNGRLITIAGIVNDKQGAADYQSFIESINLDDSIASQAPAAKPPSTAQPSTSGVPAQGQKKPSGDPFAYAPKISSLIAKCNGMGGQATLTPFVGGTPGKQFVACRKSGAFGAYLFNTIGVP